MKSSANKTTKAMSKLLDYYSALGIRSATRINTAGVIEAILDTDYEAAAHVLLSAREKNPGIDLDYDGDMTELRVPGFTFSLCSGVRSNKIDPKVFKRGGKKGSIKAHTSVYIS